MPGIRSLLLLSSLASISQERHVLCDSKFSFHHFWIYLTPMPPLFGCLALLWDTLLVYIFFLSIEHLSLLLYFTFRILPNIFDDSLDVTDSFSPVFLFLHFPYFLSHYKMYG